MPARTISPLLVTLLLGFATMATAVVASLQTVQAPFVVAGAGKGYSQPPEGYRVSTIAEIKSSKFVTFYNGGGLRVYQNETFTGCCLFMLQEGYLALDGQGVIGPYTTQGSSECTNPEQLNGTIFFGTTDPWPGVFIGRLTPATVAQLVAINSSNCDAYSSWWGIYTQLKAPFIVAGAGQGYPNPPTGYRLSNLSEIKSSKFVSYYNGGGLQLYHNQSFTGCCQFILQEGYLGLPTDVPFGPFTEGGVSECLNPEVITGSVFFGTVSPTLSYIGQLNSTTVSQLVALSTTADSQCDIYVSWWGIYTLVTGK